MNSNLIKTHILQQDSIANLTLPQDTNVIHPIPVSEINSDTSYLPLIEDTISISPAPKPLVKDTVPKVSDKPKYSADGAQAEIKKHEIGTIGIQEKISEKITEKPNIENFNLFANSDSQIVAIKPEAFLETNFTQAVNPPGKLEQIIHESKLSYLNWSLLVGILCVILLLTLKTYYKKFTFRIVNTLVNFQLADKMLREKNIIVRRAFFIMNLNYVLVLSLFILLLTFYFEFRITSSYTLDYLIINAVIIGVLIARLFLYYVAGYLFDRLHSVTEHIHMVYLVNKNLGLVLLPISFIAIYTGARFSEILLYIGFIILVLSTVYKLVRGFQIIFRSGVLLFYAILYLCTLEVLPLLLGSKLIISLR